MKLFKKIKENLAILYFKQNQTDSYFLLIRQHWSCFLKSALTLISLFVYLIHVAVTVEEFMYSMYMSTASFFIFVGFTNTVFYTATLFNFIENFEATINESELFQKKFDLFHRNSFNDRISKYSTLGSKHPSSRAIYIETNRKVEKLSEIADFIMVRVSLPGFILPKAVFCYFQYFTTDLGNDAFQLSLPMW